MSGLFALINRHMGTTENTETKSLDDYIAKSKQEWLDIVNEMNKKFKSINALRDLTSELYSQRQIALEYNNELLNKISILNKKYRVEYANKFNFYKTQSNLMYKSDSSINAQILSDLSELLYKIEIMSNFSEFMKETIKTIDDMIYAVANRIRLEELIIGTR